MAAIDFPASPTLNDIHTDANGKKWQWDGKRWIPIPYDWSNAILADGTIALTTNWDAGSYGITAASFTADTGNITVTAGNVAITAGTLTVGSTISATGAIDTTAYVHVNKASALSNADIFLDGDSGYSKKLQMRTGTSLRWTAGSSSDGETGSDAGSNYYLGRWNDSGVFQDIPFQVTRATGDAYFKYNLEVDGQAWTDEDTLTDGATVNWNCNSQVVKLTLGGNRTLAAPTNMKNGGFYALTVIQDGTGSRTITWNSVYKFAAGTAPTLTTTASAKDIFVFRSDGTNMYCVGQTLDVK